VSNRQHVLFTRREKNEGQNSSTGYVRSMPWPSAKTSIRVIWGGKQLADSFSGVCTSWSTSRPT